MRRGRRKITICNNARRKREKRDRGRNKRTDHSQQNFIALILAERIRDRLRALASTGDDDASTAVYASGLALCVGEEAIEEEDARELKKFAKDQQTQESAKKLRLQLMEERKTFVKSQNKQLENNIFYLCEH